MRAESLLRLGSPSRMRQRFMLVPLAADGHFQELTDSRLKSKTSPDTRDEPVIEEFTMGPPPRGGSLHEQHMKEQRGDQKWDFCPRWVSQRFLTSTVQVLSLWWRRSVHPGHR